MNVFYKLKSGTEILNYGREIIADIVLNYSKSCNQEILSVLDLGAGKGDDLLNSRESIITAGKKAKLYAIESYTPNVYELRANKIETLQLNIETDSFGYEDDQFDIVIMNQCLEHTKEIFHIFAEISRVLREDGICIVGVPNLASLHNRILLLFGKQPTSIKIFGPHVRGITKDGFIRFIEEGGYYKVLETFGSNFYPFPPAVSKVLCKLLPNSSVCLFFVIKRTEKRGVYSDILDEVVFETPYIR